MPCDAKGPSETDTRRSPPENATAEQWVTSDPGRSSAGDFQGLLTVLDPECVLRADAGPLEPDLSQTVRGGEEVAGQAIRFSSRAQTEEHVLVNGAAGVLVTQGGRVLSLTAFTILDERIVAMDILADPGRLERVVV